LFNLFCLSLYFVGVPPARIARLYEARGTKKTMRGRCGGN